MKKWYKETILLKVMCIFIWFSIALLLWTSFHNAVIMDLYFFAFYVGYLIYLIKVKKQEVKQFYQDKLRAFCFVLLFLVLSWMCICVTMKYSFMTQYGAASFFVTRTFFLSCMYVFFGIILSNQIQLEKIFLIFSTVFGMAFLIILPIRAVPDENMHILRAYRDADILLGKCQNDSKEFPVREIDYSLFSEPVEFYYDSDIAEWYYSNASITKWNNNYVYIDKDEIIKQNDAAYIASSLAVATSLKINLNGFFTLLSGRIANLMVYIILCYFAIKNFPYNKTIPFFISLFPMALQQGMSYSYDSLIISGSLFVVSTSLNLYENDFKASRSGILKIIFVILVGLQLISMKNHAYIMVGLFPLYLYIEKKFKVKKLSKMIMLFILAVVGIFLFYAIIDYFFDLPNIIQETEQPLSWIEGENRYTIEYFINHPMNLILIYLRTIKNYGSYYYESSVANYFGWLNIGVHPIFSYLFGGVLLSCTLFSNKKKYIKKSICIYSFIAFLITVAGIFFGLLVGWTPIGCDLVLGVQGRYFTPVIIFLVLSIYNINLKIKNRELFTMTLFSCLEILVFTELLLRI